MYYTQTTGNQVSLFDYKKHTFKNFDVPTPLSGPLGCRTSTDGALWFTEFFANKIGRLNATSGAITEYNLPALAFGPAVMRVEDGPYMYFTALVGNGIGRINKETGESEVFTYPIPAATPTKTRKTARAMCGSRLFSPTPCSISRRRRKSSRPFSCPALFHLCRYRLSLMFRSTMARATTSGSPSS